MTHGKYTRYFHSRRNGFGMNLYRNRKAKKIGGVCAGIADHFEIDHNIMRVVFIAAFLFTGMVAIWIYFIAWIVLVPKRKDTTAEEDRMNYEYDERERRYRKKNMFRYRESTGERVRRAKQRLDTVVRKVDGMEQYVTSKRFNLQQQFADLEK